MTVRQFLDLSTGHLTRTTRDRLEAGEAPTYTLSGEYGCLVYVSDEDLVVADEWDEDMLGCMAKARELGCDYVLFDADACVRDDLTYYAED